LHKDFGALGTALKLRTESQLQSQSQSQYQYITITITMTMTTAATITLYRMKLRKTYADQAHCIEAEWRNEAYVGIFNRVDLLNWQRKASAEAAIKDVTAPAAAAANSA
jgi:hypothetical protein